MAHGTLSKCLSKEDSVNKESKTPTATLSRTGLAEESGTAGRLVRGKRVAIAEIASFKI